MNRLHVFFAALLMAWGVAASAEDQPSAAPLKGVPVVKAKTDTRDIQFYTLANGMKVLLISDPEVEKSAASMDVWVGSGDDPMDRHGLAHFLEHMLFLGTEKYPQADEYQDFIAGHGGSHNAFTSATHTNYFFDIEHAHLEPALDRFSQFFISPLFNAKYVERERNAVNSEYTAKYTDEYRRVRDVYREIATPGHPVNRFSVGNLETLHVDKPRNLRDDLIDFYESHYSADRMSLVVISHQPLKVVEAWVQAKFSAVPDRQLDALVEYGSFIKAKQLPLSVTVKPRKEMREVSFVFAVPETQSHFREKPLSYIGFFLGHESEGSLLSVLKSQNWATALSAGSALAWRGGEAFAITINLTEAGLNKIAEIEALLFAYVEKLKVHGIEKWRYDEIRQLGEMAFEYGDKKNPMHEVMSVSNALHYYPAELALKAPNLYAKFDQSLIEKFLGYISPENRIRVLVDANAEVSAESEYYKTPYGVITESGSLSETELDISELKSSLALPKKNRFIPQNFSIIESKQTQSNPQRIASRPNFELWFKNDDKFELPKGYVNVRLLLPAAASSLEGASVARLYAAVTRELLNETAYSAAMAGLSFEISASSRGVDIGFRGYNDSLDQLVKSVVGQLKKYNSSPRFRGEVHDRLFDDARDELLRRYNNMSLDTPYRKILKNLPAQIFSPYWAPQTLAEALEKMDRAAYQIAVKDLFDGAQLEVFVFGNYQKNEAVKLGKQVAKLAPRKKSKPLIPDNRVVNFSGFEKGLYRPLTVEHSDAGVAYYIQGSDDSILENARILLTQQMLSTPFYASLRTEKQLGYIVFTSGYPIREVPALVAVVQSPSVPTETIVKEIDTFFESQKARVFENFERDKAALIAVLNEEAKSQGELVGDYWQAILGDDLDFDRKQRLIDAVQSLTGVEMERYYDKQLLQKRWRLIVATPPQQEDFFKDNYKTIESPEIFKKSPATYSYK